MISSEQYPGGICPCAGDTVLRNRSELLFVASDMICCFVSSPRFLETDSKCKPVSTLSSYRIVVVD